MSTGPLQTLLSALERAGCDPRRNGTGHKARCPGHDDRTASLSVTEGDDGRALVHCHAGCDAALVISTLGVAWQDLYPPRERGRRNGKPCADIAATYDYTDEHDEVLYQAVRLVPKDFRQRAPDGKGGWVWSLKGVQRRVLYRLSKVLASDAVVVVEGEKDVHTLEALGLVATTNVGGAGKWLREYTEALRGKAVVVIGDNDEPGRKHAAQVARAVHGVAAGVKVVELDGLPEKGDVSDWVARGGTLQGLVERIDATPEWVPDGGVARKASGLPQIVCAGRPDREVRLDAWAALLARNNPPRLYRRAGACVRIVDGARVDVLGHGSVLVELNDAADWVKPRGDDLRPASVPPAIVEMVLAEPSEALPRLTAVVAAPVFTADGRLIATPGYDAASGVYYAPPDGFAVPPIPPVPEPRTVAMAVELLSDLLCDFPFAAAQDKAHAFALLLLPYVRDLIRGPTPLHAITAASPGTGKTLLAQVISALVLGRTVDLLTLSDDEDEVRKRITAAMMRGQNLVVLDNLTGDIGSAQLAAAITAEVWSDRRLGQSTLIDAPNRAAWCCTVNNPRFSRELARRCVNIHFDPRCDAPWERGGWKYDLPGYACANRSHLVAACLVLVQHWLATGRSKGTARLGGFEAWSDVIGGVLHAAGVTGFLEGRGDFYDSVDAEGQAWRPFVDAWWSRFGGRPVTATALFEHIEDLGRQKIDLLSDVLGGGNDRSRKTRLGIALRGMRNRHFGARRIEVATNAHLKLATYRLVDTSPAEQQAKQESSCGTFAGPQTKGPAQGPAGQDSDDEYLS